MARVLFLGVVIIASLVMPATATPGAFVLKNEEVACFTDPGDIPGAPGFELPKGTLVITPSGHLTLTCHGELPAGFSVSETMFIPLPCTLGPPFTQASGHIIVTKSGQVNAVCHAAVR